MRIGIYTSSIKTSPNGFWSALIRMAVLACAAAAILAVLVVGVFIVLPLICIGGIALHFYIRRRLRQAQAQKKDNVIDAEYTIIKGP